MHRAFTGFDLTAFVLCAVLWYFLRLLITINWVHWLQQRGQETVWNYTNGNWSVYAWFWHSVHYVYANKDAYIYNRHDCYIVACSIKAIGAQTCIVHYYLYVFEFLLPHSVCSVTDVRLKYIRMPVSRGQTSRSSCSYLVTRVWPWPWLHHPDTKTGARSYHKDVLRPLGDCAMRCVCASHRITQRSAFRNDAEVVSRRDIWRQNIGYSSMPTGVCLCFIDVHFHMSCFGSYDAVGVWRPSRTWRIVWHERWFSWPSNNTLNSVTD